MSRRYFVGNATAVVFTAHTLTLIAALKSIGCLVGDRLGTARILERITSLAPRIKVPLGHSCGNRRACFATAVTASDILHRRSAPIRQSQQAETLFLAQLALHFARFATLKTILVAVASTKVEANALLLGAVVVPVDLVLVARAMVKREHARVHFLGVAHGPTVELRLEVIGGGVAARVGKLVTHVRGLIVVEALQIQVALAAFFGRMTHLVHYGPDRGVGSHQALARVLAGVSRLEPIQIAVATTL